MILWTMATVNAGQSIAVGIPHIFSAAAKAGHIIHSIRALIIPYDINRDSTYHGVWFFPAG